MAASNCIPSVIVVAADVVAAAAAAAAVAVVDADMVMIVAATINAVLPMLPEYIILHARVHTHNSSNGSILIIFLKYRCERMNETEREAPKKKKNAHTHTHAQTFVEHRITKQNKPKKKRTTI